MLVKIFSRFLLISTLVIFSNDTFASVYTEMNDWFNELGIYNNITGPQAISGQTGTTFTGGTLYMRSPIKNYQLFSFQPPYVRAGCGGIDLHAGAFSFINSEAFTSMLRNIGNAAIGAAFMMAVESVSPQLGSILKTMQNIAQNANNMNINSCQAGKSIATMAFDMIKSASAKEDAAIRSEAAVKTNLFTDALDAIDRATKNISDKVQALQTMKSNDPGLKEALESKNVAWYALRRLNISEDMTKLMMSLTGTVIIRSSDKSASKKTEIESKPSTITFEQLVGGPDSSQVPVKLYSCTDSDTSQYGCLSVTTYDDNLYSFYYRVKKLLIDGRSKVISRSKMNFGDNVDKSIYANSAIPIWKIVAANAAGAVSVHDDMYAKLVASKLAYDYLTNITQEIKKALSTNKSSMDEANVKATNELERNLDNLIHIAVIKYNNALQETQAIAKQQNNIQWWINTIYNNLNPNIRSKIAFGMQ